MNSVIENPLEHLVKRNNLVDKVASLVEGSKVKKDVHALNNVLNQLDTLVKQTNLVSQLDTLIEHNNLADQLESLLKQNERNADTRGFSSYLVDKLENALSVHVW